MPQVARARASLCIVRLRVIQVCKRSLDGTGRLDKGFRRVAVAIPFEKELRTDHTLSIDDKGTGIGHSLRPAFGGFVADVVGIDRLALGVGQQWEGDLRSVGELLEQRWIIIA